MFLNISIICTTYHLIYHFEITLIKNPIAKSKSGKAAFTGIQIIKINKLIHIFFHIFLVSVAISQPPLYVYIYIILILFF